MGDDSAGDAEREVPIAGGPQAARPRSERRSFLRRFTAVITLDA
jgi:hypothetical protein